MADQDFFSWAQDAAAGLIKSGVSYANTQQQQRYEIEKLKLEALGTDGYYTEGQPGAGKSTAAGGISPTVLLLGGVALVAVLMLQKD